MKKIVTILFLSSYFIIASVAQVSIAATSSSERSVIYKKFQSSIDTIYIFGVGTHDTECLAITAAYSSLKNEFIHCSSQLFINNSSSFFKNYDNIKAPQYIEKFAKNNVCVMNRCKVVYNETLLYEYHDNKFKQHIVILEIETDDFLNNIYNDFIRMDVLKIANYNEFKSAFIKILQQYQNLSNI